ncbi:MAG: VCBS repeat-containing protein, partial [Candidatus Nanopelagicales bacterium]
MTKATRRVKSRSLISPVLVGATVLSVVGAMVPAQAASRMLPAPPLPVLPAVGKYTVRDHPVSVPAVGNLATGAFLVGSGPRMRAASVHSTAATSSGTPLMADWNGDGIATPGRYDSGVWYATDTVIGKTPAWKAVTMFAGQPGDVPVVGDMTKDREPDVGFYRNGTWLWQYNGDKDKTATVQFGQAGDRPVVGDWNGDGVDDLGVVRTDGTWMLRVSGVVKRKDIKLDPGATLELHPQEKYGVVSFLYGLPTDVPVVGDWNGDGTDTPGVVRDSSTWILSRSLKRLSKPFNEVFPVPSGATALVGTRATGIASCPTATPTSEKRALELAARVRPAADLHGNAKSPGMPEILATVQDGLRFSITNDLTKRVASQVTYPYYDVINTHKSIEESVRRSANVALAAAIMLTTSNWKTVNAITRAELLSYAKWQIRSIACQHDSITPGGWGTTWQSALWASTAGQAGWLL